jgi:hypothetical protein
MASFTEYRNENGAEPGSIAVPRDSALRVGVSDPSGVDPASLVFLLDGTSHTLTAPELTFDDGILQYTDTVPLGAQGATVALQVVAADLSGNIATSAVSTLLLAVDPVAAPGVLVLGPAAAPQQSPATLSLASPQSGDFVTLVAVLSDRLVFAYAGNHGLQVGQLLASDDPDCVQMRKP